MFNNFSTQSRATKPSGFTGVVFSAILLVTADASAIPIDANVSITASINLSTLSSAAPAGITQSGTFSQVIGGATTSSTVNNAFNVTGTLPLDGTLTDIGDGVGVSFLSNGNFSGDDTGSSTRLFADYSVSLANTSLTDTFKITLGLEFTNDVDANGEDAGIEGEIILSEGATEIFFSNLVSDILFGDEAGGLSTGTPSYDIPFADLGSSGAALLDDGTVLFDFILAPGQTANLTGQNDLFGVLFDGDYSATVASRIFVSAVDNQTTQPPSPVPEPAGLWLFAAGLMGLRAVRQSRATS